MWQISIFEFSSKFSHKFIYFRFGCCPDGITSASGPYFSGCYDCVEGSGDCSFCNQTLGCEKETSEFVCDVRLIVFFYNKILVCKFVNSVTIYYIFIATI